MIKEVKGWHVLVILFAFFGVIMAVNTVFLTRAFQTFPGEDHPRSYVQGRAYNEVLDERAAQAALGWTATASVSEAGVIVEVTDRNGAPVSGLEFAASLRHPATSRSDIALTLVETMPGTYAADIAIPLGQWRLSARAGGETPFELEQPVWLR